MNCAKARSLLMPWLDSELDARSLVELQEHLRDCRACARRFESEARVEPGLLAPLGNEPLPDDIWQRCVGALDERSAWRAPRWPRVAAAAAMLLVLAALWWHWSGTGQAAPVDLFAQFRTAYAAQLSGQAEPELTSGDAAVLQAWLDAHGSGAFRVPEPGHHFGHLLSVVGVRTESFANLPVVALLVNCCGHPATVFLMDGSEADRLPAQTAAQLHGGGTAQVTLAGVTTAAFLDRNLLVSVVYEHAMPLEIWRSS